MKHLFTLLLISITFLVSGQKKILKQAAAFEESEMYEQAAEKYIQALYQNATRPESRQGLIRTSQKVVNQKLSGFFIARNSSDKTTSIRKFEELLAFRNKLVYFNINPDIPQYHFDDYESDKKQLLEDLKKQAADALTEGNESEVKELVRKIQRLDPDFDKEELARIESSSLLVPTYNQAVEDFEKELWLTAWKGFSEAEKLKGNYLNTKNYKARIKEKANTLAILLPKRSRLSEVEYFKDNIIAEVSKLDNPLIKIINRENLDQIIEEQKLGLSGVIDEKSAASLGRILGVKAIMLIKILNYEHIPGKLISIEKIAYIEPSNFVYQNKYDPVPYKEYSQSNKLLVSLQYQLISTETAEILKADIFQKQFSDDLICAKSTTNHHLLYPAIEGYIYKSGPERLEFLKLFEAQRDALTEKELEFKVQGLLSKEVAQSLNEYYSK